MAKRGGSSKTSPDDDVPECLTWLDSQPNQSVEFLCFVSLGLLTMEQLRGIAIELKKSGQSSWLLGTSACFVIITLLVGESQSM